MFEAIERAAAAVARYTRENEPVAAVNVIVAAVTAFTVEAQGDLTGTHAWVAVGWAILAVVTRQVVTPAARRTP